MSTLDTSKAKTVCLCIHNYDDIPLSLTYSNKNPVTPINLTDYKFEFFLNQNKTPVTSYEIDAGVLATGFLTKTGDNINILNMRAMFEDIRDNNLEPGVIKYKLIQVVTDGDGNKYVHVVYIIDARRY